MALKLSYSSGVLVRIQKQRHYETKFLVLHRANMTAESKNVALNDWCFDENSFYLPNNDLSAG